MTTLPSGYRTTDIPQARHGELIALDTWAFPTGVSEEKLLELPMTLDWDRARGVETDDGELVACHGSYPYQGFPVPGARTGVSGLTWVGVHPGHRRRGLLRAMIEDHFTRSRARGEAVSALFAAEPGIYGRFGYGLASSSLSLTMDRRAALRDVPGATDLRVRIERVDPARHAELVARVHGRIDRPGWVTRTTPGQHESWLEDPEAFRDGAESLRIVIVGDDERDESARGFALFRRKDDWKAEGPRGVVRVREAVAPDAATARALWGVLLDLDLMGTVEVSLLPVDDPLWFLLVDPRAARPRITDNLWVRLLDVPTALAARRYQTAVDVVIEVRDAGVPANAGRWRLVGSPDGATATPADGAADLTIDVRELASAYLGGVSLEALAAAGLVTEHTPGTVRRAAVAFAWPVAPACSWIW